MKIRRFISMILVVSVVFSCLLFSGCTQKYSESQEENSHITSNDSNVTIYDNSEAVNTKSTAFSKQNTDTSLEAYFKENYSSKNSDKHIYDFNGDGKKEMLVVECNVSEKNILTSCDLYLITESDGKAKLSSSYKINNSIFSEYPIFINVGEDSLEWLKQYIEVYVNSSGYISCNIYEQYQGCVVNYFIFDISNNELNVKQHLLDPGYTSGIGLYYYDIYIDDYKKAELYGEEMGQKSGEYSSYIVALNKTIGNYGFTFSQSKSVGDKYIIEASTNCSKVYSFSTF